MITLYTKTGCPFCERVKKVFNAYQIPFDEKNVADTGVSEELVALGGKKQEPFMVDGDTMLYESQSIIEYVESTYRQGTDGVKRPKVHFAQGTEVCPS